MSGTVGTGSKSHIKMRWGHPSALVSPFLATTFLHSSFFLELPLFAANKGLALPQLRRRLTTVPAVHVSPRHFHIGLSHLLWGQFVQPGDVLVDATCGNGFDSAVLAELCLNKDGGRLGHLYCLDIQQEAIDRTKARLRESGKYNVLQHHIHFHCQNFTAFPPPLGQDTFAKLVVYNLGYLPNADKSITTKTEDTLASLQQVVGEGGILAPEGLLSVTLYPFHKEGRRETKAVLDFMQGLDMKKWRVFCHSPLNRPGSPILLTALKLPV